MTKIHLSMRGYIKQPMTDRERVAHLRAAAKWGACGDGLRDLILAESMEDYFESVYIDPARFSGPSEWTQWYLKQPAKNWRPSALRPLIAANLKYFIQKVLSTFLSLHGRTEWGGEPLWMRKKRKPRNASALGERLGYGRPRPEELITEWAMWPEACWVLEVPVEPSPNLGRNPNQPECSPQPLARLSYYRMTRADWEGAEDPYFMRREPADRLLHGILIAHASLGRRPMFLYKRRGARQPTPEETRQMINELRELVYFSEIRTADETEDD